MNFVFSPLEKALWELLCAGETEGSLETPHRGQGECGLQVGPARFLRSPTP